jgi:acyl-CoA thioesterase I
MRVFTVVLALAGALAACSGAGAGAGGAAADGEALAEPTGRAAVASPAAASLTAAPSSGRSSRPRVVFLGDSLTAGLGLAPSESVPALIQTRVDAAGYGFDVVNAGVSGDTSAGGLRRLEWSLDGDVRVLVVELGANDGLRGLATEELERNLVEILAKARARGVSVVLTGMEAPPNYGPDYTNAFRQVYQRLGRSDGITFIPFFLEGVAGNPGLNQRDGIHPNPEGARVVHEHLWRTLEPVLRARASR